VRRSHADPGHLAQWRRAVADFTAELSEAERTIGRESALGWLAEWVHGNDLTQATLQYLDVEMQRETK
jgi:hypothetical protein